MMSTEADRSHSNSFLRYDESPKNERYEARSSGFGSRNVRRSSQGFERREQTKEIEMDDERLRAVEAVDLNMRQSMTI